VTVPETALGLESAPARAVLDSLLDPHVMLAAVRDESGRIVDLVDTEANPAACVDDRLPRDQFLGSRSSSRSAGSSPRHPTFPGRSASTSRR